MPMRKDLISGALLSRSPENHADWIRKYSSKMAEGSAETVYDAATCDGTEQ